MTMTESEKVHFLTEGIYRNLMDNFNPGIRQLISTGRAFQKALHHVATAAKVYIDCIYALSQTAQVCKGATSEIGHSLLQIAEVHKEINTQVIDNIKSFHAELLIPMETKQDNEFKQIANIHKKYLAGHKYHTGPLEKAQSVLKKHRKKSKSAKYGFDQKDLQYARDVRECQIKLDEYRMQNLRQALMEERKRYTFLLDRVCAMVRNYASHHSKAQELLTHRLQEWSDLCKNPHSLPESSEHVIHSFKIHHEDVYNSPDDMRGNHDYADPSNHDNVSMTYGTSPPPSLTYGTSAANIYHTNHESDYGVSRGLTGPKTPSKKVQQVRALYNHHGNNETQLNFVEGDIITLIGEKRDGWHYGENTSTNRMGWFPITFTERVDTGGTPNFGHQRVRSLGNLADMASYPGGANGDMGDPPDGMADYGNDMGTLHRSNTITERPISMYASRQSVGQAQSQNKMTPDDRSVTMGALSGLSMSRSQTMPFNVAGINHSQYPGSVPDVSMLTPRDQYGTIGAPTAGPPPPALPPPPPPPPNPPPSHHQQRQEQYHHHNHHHQQQQHPGTPHHRLSNMNSSPALLLQGRGYQESPPLPPPPPQQQGDYGTVGHKQMTMPSPPQSSSGYSGSSNRANQSSGSGSHYSIYGGGGGSQYPPPPGFPPPPPAPAPPPPTSDYDEEPRSNPFAKAHLKKTLTNDRSSPRIF